jgi:hypothetical protein
MGILDQVGGFLKGAGQGAVNGVVGAAEGLGTLASDGYKVATDGQYRQQAWNDAVAAAQKVGDFANEVVTNPGQAAQDVGNAAQGAYDQFQASAQQAAAQGRSGEFYGNLFGQGAVLIGTALIPGGAEAEGLSAAGTAGRVAEGATALADAGKAAEAGSALATAGRADAALTGSGLTGTELTGGGLTGAGDVAELGGADAGTVGLGGGGGTLPPGGGDVSPASPSYPDGLAFRSDLPDHLAGPDGFKGGLLNGTHNADNAISQLEGRGATQVDALQPGQPGYTLTDTDTPGVSTLDYNVVNPNTGVLKTGSKTVYDPSVYSNAQMLDLSQDAGSDAFARYMQDPANTPTALDGQAGGVTFRSYINFDKATGSPYVGNVHPIDPADAVDLGNVTLGGDGTAAADAAGTAPTGASPAPISPAPADPVPAPSVDAAPADPAPPPVAAPAPADPVPSPTIDAVPADPAPPPVISPAPVAPLPAPTLDLAPIDPTPLTPIDPTLGDPVSAPTLDLTPPEPVDPVPTDPITPPSTDLGSTGSIGDDLGGDDLGGDSLGAGDLGGGLDEAGGFDEE